MERLIYWLKGGYDFVPFMDRNDLFWNVVGAFVIIAILPLFLIDWLIHLVVPRDERKRKPKE